MWIEGGEGYQNGCFDFEEVISVEEAPYTIKYTRSPTEYIPIGNALSAAGIGHQSAPDAAERPGISGRE